MSTNVRGKRRGIKKIAVALILSLILSELPVMKLEAAPGETGQSSVVLTEVPKEENNGTEIGEPGGESGNQEGNRGEDGTGGEEGGSGTGDENDEDTDGTKNEGEEGKEDDTAGDEETDSDEEEENALENGEDVLDDLMMDEEEEQEEGLLTEEEIAAQKAMRPQNMPELEVFELPEHYEAISTYSILPAKYDSRDSEILSPVRNQNPWGTCWAHATLGTMETSLVKREIVEAGKADLSERHLTYFTYNTGYDRLGNANGDTITYSGNYFNAGGNAMLAAMRLMNWQGAAAESSYPYSNSYTMPSALNNEKAQDDIYHMRDCYFLDTKANDTGTIQNVKTLVKEYGCAEWSYFDDDDYHNYSTKAYYNNRNTSDKAYTNHSIMIVGWDDNFSRDKFGSSASGNQKPKNDGAWIVRNSWSEKWGENGYFYISYEDTSLGSGNAASVMIADPGDNYDNNYFYSNTNNHNWYGYGGRFAQVYQVKGLETEQEQLRAVSFMVGSTNTECQIQIYKNPQLLDGVVVNPKSGTPMLDEPISQVVTYSGIYTVDLPQPITFDKDDYMAVVISFPYGDGLIYIDESGSRGSTSWSNETAPGESLFSYSVNGYNWYDLNDFNNRHFSLRINLLTDNVAGGTDTELMGSASVTQPSDFVDTYKVSLRWNKLVNISSYEIYRSASRDGSYEKVGDVDASVKQYKDEIAWQDYAEKYYYKVKGVFTDGTSLESEPIEVQLEERIEFRGFKLSFDGETAELSWNAVAGAVGYEIQRKEEKESDYRTIASDVTGTAYSDDLSDAEEGDYQYRIRARGSNNRYTKWSQEESALKGCWKITQVNYNTLKFSFPPKESDCSYMIYIKLGNSTYTYGQYIKSQTANINIEDWIKNLQRWFPDKAVPDFHVGDSYSFWVQLRNASYMPVSNYPSISYRTIPDALGIRSLEFTDKGAVELTWSGGAGADTVEIYRSETQDDYGEVYRTAEIGKGSFTDSDVVKGKTYYYRVCPTVQNSSGETVKGEISQSREITIPLLTQNTVLKSVEAVSDTEVKLSWEENADADGYYIYRSNSKNGENVQLAEITDGTAISYRDTGVAAGQEYYYSIAAYVEENGETKIGKVSDRIGVRTLPSKPEMKEPTLTDAGVEVQWNTADGAGGYILERRVSGGDFEQLTDVKGGSKTDYTDASVLSGNTYTYRVKAYNEALDRSRQYGAVSGEKTIIVTVGALQNLKAEYSDGIVALSWDKVSRAKAYNIYATVDGSGDKLLDTVEGNSYQWREAKTGHVYGFRVAAVTQTGTESGQAGTCEIAILPDSVSISTVSAISGSVLNIRWNGNGAEGAVYDVYRSDSASGEYTLLADSVEGDSFEDEAVVTGKTYYYKIIIHINGLESQLSDTVAKTGQTRPDRPVSEETDYDRITIRSNSDLEYAIGTVYGDPAGRRFVQGTGNSLTFDGLAQNSQYYIMARTRKEITGETPVYGAELAVRTKVKAQLVLSPSGIVLSKGNRVNFTATIAPENIHYKELSWTAADWSGKACTVGTKGNATVVSGDDGKEILRIVDGRIYATGDSKQKEVCLQAEKGSMKATMKVRINVPVTALTIQAESVDKKGPVSLDSLQVGDEATLSVKYAPDNADDGEEVNWSVSNVRVASVEKTDSANAVLTAKGAGECVLKAVTADGVSVERKIRVKKAETIYGIWLSDEAPGGMKAEKDEDGIFTAQVKPVYTLEAGTGEETDASLVLDAYLLTEENLETQAGEVVGGTLRKAKDGEVTYRSADTSVVTVDSHGKVTAVGEGKTDIFAVASKGGSAFGSCQIEVTGNRMPESESGDCAVAKDRKLSAVSAALQIQQYGNDSQSSCRLQVKDQSGALLDSALFTYKSADSSVCIVDEDGVVTPNPGLAGKKNAAVKITAFLKNDPAKRKVIFTVTVLAANQVDWIVLERIRENGETGTAESEIAEGVIGQKFEKGTTMTFAAKAYDSNQNLMENPSLSFSVSDGSVAAIKVNKDKTLTLTLKKPGRVNLICTAKDNLKHTTSIQVAAVASAPIISAKQINVNRMLAETEKSQCISESFLVTPPMGARTETPEIVSVKTGKTDLAEATGLGNFRIAENADGSYSIALDNADGFVSGIRNNTIYTVEMRTQVEGIPEIEDGGAIEENFSIKVKVISAEPKLSVTVPGINRAFVQDEDVSGLLVIKAADVVTDVRVLDGTEQINGFEQYFETYKENGQWYLRFKDETGLYSKTSLKGKIAFTVNGYKPVIKAVTVKTPLTRQNIKQQSVPSIHDSVSQKAEIVLYNSTQKKVLESCRITDVESTALDVAVENDGTLQAVIKNGASYKNGATLTAKIKVMETRDGKDCWGAPVELKISVKVFTSKNPAVSMKASTLTLNKNTPAGTGETQLTVNYQNVRVKDVPTWQLYAYNSVSKKYDLQGDMVNWLALSYDEKTQTFAVGYTDRNSDLMKAGSYKFRLSGFVEGFDDLYKDFTVKIIDVKPTATVNMSGKLDLVNRASATLSGKITIKNSTSLAESVAILNEDGTENALYRAGEVSGSSFKVVLTEEGMKAPLTTQKQTLPVRITLKNGYVAESSISFKPVQTTPRITVPAAQTIYKSVGNVTRDYDMTGNQTAGTAIKKIDIVSAPNGLGAIAKEGHVLVTLGDRGLKAASYTIKMNIYFEGEEAVTGNPNGKPLSKTLTVKVAE